MKNQNSNQTTATTPVLNLCEVCKETGKYGAQWLVYIEGQSKPVQVHKPCGETLVKSAPEGVTAKVVPSRELRELWNQQRQEKSAKSFWDQRFSQAKPLLKPKPAPVTPVAILAEAAQAA